MSTIHDEKKKVKIVSFNIINNLSNRHSKELEAMGLSLSAFDRTAEMQ